MTVTSFISAAAEVDPHRTEVVRLDEITKTFGALTPVHALRATSLTVQAGEYVAVVGASGSGKSTLLNVLGLLDRPTSGEYFLNGQPTCALSEGRRSALRSAHVGFVFQSFHLLAHRNARQNVELGLLYQGVHRDEREIRAEQALVQVGLVGRIDHLPGQLSGGERQRVALARALVADPSLLLCDEPTGNLDSATGDMVLQLIEGCRDRGKTLVMVTHDDRIANRAERILRVRDGQVTDSDRAAP